VMKEAVPRASRIAVLSKPDNPWHSLVVKDLRREHRLPGVQLEILEVRRSNEFGNAFQAMMREHADGVLVLADPMTFTHRKRLTELAAKHRVPLMGGPRGYTEAGGLMSYWADELELSRRAASYAEKRLRGATPDSLPIEQPTKYELMVNLKTAKALALTIQPSLLVRATVIE